MMRLDTHPIYQKYDFHHLENMWLVLVLNVIKDLIDRKMMCDCEDCVLDVTALALNQLPSNFWVFSKFNALTPPERFFEDRKNKERARDAVVSSLAQVKKNPHHM